MPTPVPPVTHNWSPPDPGTPARRVLVHGATGWHRTWWRVGPALADRGWTVVAHRPRLQPVRPRNARVVVLDAGHATHRDRCDEFLAAVVGWIEADA